MTDPVRNVLFICSRNSARSILAEAILNAEGPDRFRAWSAGSTPAGHIDPLALAVLAERGLPIDGYRSKNWSEFAHPEAPRLDFVVTVCDTAAGETCPVWPGQPITAHWGVEDPVAVEGNEDVRLRAFRNTANVLKRRIDLMLSLPIDSLDLLSQQTEVRAIGTR